MSEPAPTCARHPAIPAIALCVGCGAVLCAACTTRVQGRNLCASCLGETLGAGRRDEQPAVAAWVAPLLTLGALAGFTLLTLLFVGVAAALHALG